MISFDNNNKCHRLAGDSGKTSTFGLLSKENLYFIFILDKTDPFGGLQITLNSGDVCDDKKYSVTYNILCNPEMEKGVVKFNNEDEFSVNKCNNVLNGQSRAACPFVNYYIIAYFLNQYSLFLGAAIIVIGLFLLILGLKFIKATIFVSAAMACTTLSAVLYFNIFNAESTTTVWIVLGIGFLIGILLGYFLINITSAFFMLIGGYMGYTLGVFLYHLFLNLIHADPKLIYWVTIVASVVICALLALWIVKHVLVFATSIIGGYAVVRGASLYLGHFPSESLIMDLVQHEEWDQLDDAFDGYVYAYLSAWVLLAVGGILWQYKVNQDKSSDDYRKLNN